MGEDGDDGGNGGDGDDGDDGDSEDRRIGITQHSVGGAWITAFFEAGEVYCDSQGIEYETFLHDEDATEQIGQIRQMVNQGYDGIVAVPYDEAVDTAIEEAEEAGIPVFSANNTIESEHIKTFTAFGNYNAGATCAEGALDELEAQKPDQDTWEILNVRGDFFFQSNQRTDGFVETIEEHEKTEVVDTIQTDWSQDDAQQKTAEWLNAHSTPDAVYSSNMTSGLGVFTALEREDLVYEKGHEDHIVHAQLDGGPDVNPRVADGYIDLAVDQPNYFYIPLAVAQMQQYWENGEDALPEPGTELTEDDIQIEPAEHNDVELWSEPIWAPAEVVEANGHVNVRTAGITITEENADEPHHWGNIWG